jgi:hypothetical protein
MLSDVRLSVNVYIFEFSRTTGPILTRLGTDHPCVEGIQLCSNKQDSPSPRGLIIYGFTSCSRIFHLYGDVTIAGEGLKNLDLCTALRAFEQGGIFIMPQLL